MLATCVGVAAEEMDYVIDNLVITSLESGRVEKAARCVAVGYRRADSAARPAFRSAAVRCPAGKSPRRADAKS